MNHEIDTQLRLRGLVALLVPLLACGCAPHPQAPLRTAAAGARTLPRATSAVPTAAGKEKRVLPPSVAAAAHVQALPEYAKAKATVSRGDYRGAATLLARLEKSGKLTPEQKEFCYQQELICLGHVSKAASEARRAQGAGIARVATPKRASAPTDVDCGPRALLLACEKLGVKTSLPALRQAAKTDVSGTTLAGLKKASEALGMKTEAVQAGREALPQLAMPAVAWVNGDHYVAVLSLSGVRESGTARIHDPNEPKERTVSQERLLQLSSGYLLTLRR